MDTTGDLPPGTSYLFDEDGHRQNKVVLEPIPTSDPNDPLNWSSVRKQTNFWLTMVATTIIFTAVSIQSVMWQPMMDDHGMDVNQDQLVNASAVGLAGTALGCTLLIPFAIKYGRRSNYIIAIFFMLLLSVWQALMTSYKEVYVTQFFMGLAQAPNETIVQMTIGDIFFVHQRGAADGWYMNMVNIGSFLSPIIAGYISEAQGWRFTYWLCTLFYGLILIAFIFFFEETKYTPTLSAAIAQIDPTSAGPSTSTPYGSLDLKNGNDSKDNKDTPLSQTQIDAIEVGEVPIDESIPRKTYWQRMAFITKTDESMWPLYWRPFYLLVSFPNILYTGLMYAFSLCWISVLAMVQAMFMPLPPYNMSPGAIGLQSLGPFIGCVLGAVYCGFFSDWLIIRLARKNHGYFEPEMRLHASHIGALAQPAGLLMFGICLAQERHWMLLQVGGAIFGFGLGCISTNAITLTIDSYRGVTGEAFVGVAFLRNCFSIVLVFAINPWLAHQGVQNMFIVVGVWSFVVCCLHLPLLRWGKWFRIKTAPAYKHFLEMKGEGRT
ncbi:hypothetical protein KEM56_006781 [Ascosphaera pollenicola]|nr:hypothetical protein KEM56_006781 [Ascosphaera pollenicola]